MNDVLKQHLVRQYPTSHMVYWQSIQCMWLLLLRVFIYELYKTYKSPLSLNFIIREGHIDIYCFNAPLSIVMLGWMQGLVMLTLLTRQLLLHQQIHHYVISTRILLHRYLLCSIPDLILSCGKLSSYPTPIFQTHHSNGTYNALWLFEVAEYRGILILLYINAPLQCSGNPG